MDRRIWKTRVAAAAIVSILAGAPAPGAVIVSDPDDPLPFLNLDRPTGEFDETSLTGFEYLISSQVGGFREADQYLIAGSITDESTSLTSDLGDVSDLSSAEFAFSIRHHLDGGRNFTFTLENLSTHEIDGLCWGTNCAPGLASSESVGGLAPIDDFNGLQIQVRAQDVANSSAKVEILSLNGVDVSGAAFFDETVAPSSPGTIPGDDGRRGQWMLADDLDFLVNEWELTGLVTLARPDAAVNDVTKVRLAVDLVRDPSLPFVVPEPSAPLLLGCAFAALGALSRWRRATT